MSTITREFTKEQLIEKLQHRIAVTANYPDVEEAQFDAAIFKIALASLEAEAVVFVMADDLKDSSIISTPAYRDLGEAMERTVGDVVALYAAHPTPVSVIEPVKTFGIGTVFKPQILSVDEVDCDNCAHYQPNICHGEGCPAAMLQGADGNSPVIQDGSEDTKRLDWLDAQNKRLNEYYGTTYGWKFDANFQRNAMMLNDSNYPVMTVRQAIDEAITAAPQQEVKP